MVKFVTLGNDHHKVYVPSTNKKESSNFDENRIYINSDGKGPWRKLFFVIENKRIF